MRVVLNIPVERLGSIVAPFIRSRWKWPLVLAAVGVFVVFGVGVVSLGRSVLKPRPAVQQPNHTGAAGGVVSAGQTGSDSADRFAPVSQIDFGYLTPKLDPNWDYDAGSLAYDAAKGVVRYSLKFHHNNVGVVITEQAMPSQLMPRTSDAFTAFLTENKVFRSQDVGKGTIYFLPAMKNGVLGGGADTVIFATDSILLFGKADSFVGFDPWLELMAAMQPAK